MTAIRVLLAVLVLTLASAPVHPVPLTYTELLNGDLAGQNIGTFDVGVNTVQGTFCFTPGIAGCGPSAFDAIDVDDFRFNLPSGQTITQAQFSFVTAPSPVTLSAQTEFDLYDADPNPDLILASSGAFSVLLPGTASPFSAVLPLSNSGEFLLDHADIVLTCGSGFCGIVTTYTWSFVVTPQGIPEPGTLMLLAAAFVSGFARTRRPSKRQA